MRSSSVPQLMRFTPLHLRLFVARFMLATSRCGSRLSRLTNLPCDWSKLDRWISDHDARLSPACKPTNVGSSFWRRATSYNSSALALVRLRDPCVNGARAGSSPPSKIRPRVEASERKRDQQRLRQSRDLQTGPVRNAPSGKSLQPAVRNIQLPPFSLSRS